MIIKESNNDYSNIYIKSKRGGSCYLPEKDIICLYLKKGFKISDNDLETYFCDVLIHESLHKTLYDLYPNEEHRIKFTICCYLDIIQQYFRSEEYLKITETLYNAPNPISWDKHITIFGLKSFFRKYGIKPDEVKYTNDLLNFRNEKGGKKMEVEFKLKKKTTIEEADGEKTKLIYVPIDDDLKKEVKLEVAMKSIASSIGLPVGFIDDTVMIDIGRKISQTSIIGDDDKKEENKEEKQSEKKA